MEAKQIGIRVTPSELVALRRVPGNNDSARIRALIQNQGISDGLVHNIAEVIRQENAQLLAGVDKQLSASEQRVIDSNKAQISRLVSEMNKPFMQILDHIRRTKQ